MEDIMALVISLKATFKEREYQINFKFDEPFSKTDIHKKSAMLTESAIRVLEEKENIIFID
jgi:hypothetical protein